MTQRCQGMSTLTRQNLYFCILWPGIEPLMKTRWGGLPSPLLALHAGCSERPQLSLSTGRRHTERSQGPKKFTDKSPETESIIGQALSFYSSLLTQSWFPVEQWMFHYPGSPLVPGLQSQALCSFWADAKPLVLHLLSSLRQFDKYWELGRACDHKQTLASSEKL